MIEFFKSFIITPIALLWENIYRLRRYLYNFGLLKRFSFQMPIVSVGNISFGGTGKTPFTIWLTELIEQYHLRPVILTRGYKGKLENSYGLVEAKKSFKYNPVDFGDEPLMMARRLKEGAVIVGKRRSENLCFFFDQLKPDIGILDDGFQHLRLFSNFNIVLFDALMPIGQYKVAPKGHLREGLTSLKDADAIVISRCDQTGLYDIQKLEEFLRPYVSPRAIWSRIKYRPVGIYNANFQKVFGPEQLREKNIISVVAIASPQSFLKQLEGLGVNIVEEIVFPDHYYFTFEDIQNLLEKSKQYNAMIITSEKDIVKMRKISTEVQIYYMEVSVEFISGEEELKRAAIKVLNLEP